jgi:hypothetical protein
MVHVPSAFPFVGKLARELFDRFDLLFGHVIDVCEFSVELIFESCLRFGLGGSNTHPLAYVLLYLLTVIRFSLKERTEKKRQLRG